MKMQVSVPFNGWVNYVIDVPNDVKDPREFADKAAQKLFDNDTLTFESANGEVTYDIRGENGDDDVEITEMDDNSEDDETP